MSTSWETGLCACMEDKASALDSVCCFPSQIGRQCAALDDQVNQLAPLWCVLSAIGCAPIAICGIRTKVVSKYNLDETRSISVCIGCLYPVCSLCQTHRELTLRNAWPGGACVQQPFFTPNAPIS